MVRERSGQVRWADTVEIGEDAVLRSDRAPTIRTRASGDLQSLRQRGGLEVQPRRDEVLRREAEDPLRARSPAGGRSRRTSAGLFDLRRDEDATVEIGDDLLQQSAEPRCSFRLRGPDQQMNTGASFDGLGFGSERSFTLRAVSTIIALASSAALLQPTTIRSGVSSGSPLQGPRSAANRYPGAR
jgi:hypothetical protein